MIGRQRIEIDLNPGSFRRELSRARTFGFMKDVERLWAAGLALGASLENTVAIGDDRIINREGLRYSDEFVRHKALEPSAIWLWPARPSSAPTPHGAVVIASIASC